jgi:hypothetical protein
MGSEDLPVEMLQKRPVRSIGKIVLTVAEALLDRGEVREGATVKYFDALAVTG